MLFQPDPSIFLLFCHLLQLLLLPFSLLLLFGLFFILCFSIIFLSLSLFFHFQSHLRSFTCYCSTMFSSNSCCPQLFSLCLFECPQNFIHLQLKWNSFELRIFKANSRRKKMVKKCTKELDSINCSHAKRVAWNKNNAQFKKCNNSLSSSFHICKTL